MQDGYLILGMHRSGTSALAGVLSKLGISPPRTLMTADMASHLIGCGFVNKAKNERSAIEQRYSERVDAGPQRLHRPGCRPLRLTRTAQQANLRGGFVRAETQMAIDMALIRL